MFKMRERVSYIVIALNMFSLVVLATEEKYVPKQGFVPNKIVAIRIAEAVLPPIYGEQILQQRPFKVTLIGDRWFIEGSFNHPKGWTGGVFYIEIKKSNGEILKVYHTK